uniref:Uncharacterized protein n=1 Tax=Knipowitschia caucasica TaxID=637954 RepID=A0AAV2K4C7_KNICA
MPVFTKTTAVVPPCALTLADDGNKASSSRSRSAVQRGPGTQHLELKEQRSELSGPHSSAPLYTLVLAAGVGCLEAAAAEFSTVPSSARLRFYLWVVCRRPGTALSAAARNSEHGSEKAADSRKL